LAACTITSKNHLAFARVFATSFREHHPDIPIYLLLVDRVDGCFDARNEPFHLVQLEDVGIPDLHGFCFKYDVTELNCAVKPYFLDYLFRCLELEKLIFFDCDILFFDKVSEVYTILDDYSMVLTPHLTAWRQDEDDIGLELEVLQSGTFNLGFIGLSNTPIARDFLNWWQTRLHSHCQMAHERGMHTDQKWVELAPSLFGDVYVLRHPGYNVAYWNLRTRRIGRRGESFVVNGRPLHFFHFSGFNPLQPERVSRHDRELTTGMLDDGAAIFDHYAALTLKQGYEEVRRWPYAFSQFDNGVKIHPGARSLYLRLGNEARRFGNPFTTSRPGSFFKWLSTGVDESEPETRVSWLWQEIHRRRKDLQRAFPDPLGEDREAFLSWIKSSGIQEEGIDLRLVPDSLVAVEAERSITHLRRNQTEKFAARPFGVNVAGYVASEKGTGEGVRATIRSLEAAGIPFVVNSIRDVYGARNREEIGSAAVMDDNPFRINLVHVNADQLPSYINAVGLDYVRERYNIGFWYWELDEFPSEWLGSFQYLDEVWVASRFVQESVSRVSPIPVVRVPLAVAQRPEPQAQDRRRFGISAHDYIVLFMFDFYSYFERKNPLAVIEAFKMAFSDRNDVRLVIKSAHSEFDPANLARLQHAIEEVNGVIIDDVLSRHDVDALMSIADCFVSLHRSEGFGISIAESMLLGKPVIATGYSGNMDFMNQVNGFPVRYRLIEITEESGPYRRGALWAEPDVEHAAELMRLVYEDRDRAQTVAEEGRQTILRDFSPSAAGKVARDRLELVAGDGRGSGSSGIALYVIGGAASDRNPGWHHFPLINRKEGESAYSHLTRVVRLIEKVIESGGTHLLVPREYADWLGDHRLLVEYFTEEHQLVDADAATGIVFKLIPAARTTSENADDTLDAVGHLRLD
jgi:glycosyltransferase involved in cell wall biosynthesis